METNTRTEMEEKLSEREINLLVTDLCGRLPHGVAVEITFKDGRKADGMVYAVETATDVYAFCCKDIDGDLHYVPLAQMKPYLIPLNELSDEQSKALQDTKLKCELLSTGSPTLNYSHLFDFMDRNGIDYRNLIDDGLALNANDYGIIYELR